MTDGAPPAPPEVSLRALYARFVLIGVVGGYAGLLFARLYRPDPSDGMGGVETLLAWASLMATTFTPHAGMALVVVLISLFLVRARRTALVAAPLLAASLGPWMLSFAPDSRGAPSSGEALLVLSANLLGPSRSDEELLAQIERHDPDIIMLQEVTPRSWERLERALGARYEAIGEPREHLFGEAVFTRLPLAGEPRVVLPRSGQDQPQMLVRVEWSGVELALLNVHLLPPSGRTLVAGQAVMAWELGGLLDTLDGPVIVAGDFNGPWRSQPLDALRERGFNESHRVAGVGPGSTWPAHGLASLFPGIRIDHVAGSAQLVCIEAWVGEETSSDHRPNFARFVLTGGPDR